VWASVRKQLICPQCGTVMAEVCYRSFPPRLRIISLEGVETPPESVALQLLRAKAAGEANGSAGDRVAFLERNFDELVYDLRCRSGHSTLRTMPQLARAVRRAGGQWVDLTS
jgi:hypothetical protein